MEADEDGSSQEGWPCGSVQRKLAWQEAQGLILSASKWGWREMERGRRGKDSRGKVV